MKRPIVFLRVGSRATWKPFLASLTTTLLLTSCNSNSALPSVQAKEPQAVKTMTVQIQDVEDVLEIPARVQPDPANVVHIYPPAGGRLLQVKVRPGDRVRKGQTIAIEESSDVAQARSDYGKAKAEFEKENRALQRSKLLLEHKALSERELEETEANYDEAKSELDRATDRLRVLGAPIEGSSSLVNLLAPKAGAVLEIGAASGEISKSTDNANSIATIADLGTVWVVGDVFEKDLALVKAGAPVEVSVSAYPGRYFDAKIATISDALDPQSRTAKARVILPNPKSELKADMFATIRIRRPSARLIVVPASAVLHDGGDTAVMVQSKPGAYERRLVTVHSANAKEVVITAGLNPGEVIVSEGAALLRGGGDE